MDKFKILETFCSVMNERLKRKTGWGRKEIEQEMQLATIETLKRVDND